MEKVTDSQTPYSFRVIEVTPDQLRIIADRLDQEALKVSQKGEYVLYELTPKIMLMFSPRKEKP